MWVLSIFSLLLLMLLLLRFSGDASVLWGEEVVLEKKGERCKTSAALSILKFAVRNLRARVEFGV